MSKGKLLAVCFVWLAIVGAMAAAYRILIYNPNREEVFETTGSSSNYKHNVGVALDSFSGYAILRSPYLKKELASKKIRLNFVDDGADYPARLESLSSGKTPVAVFTIDALLKTCEQSGSLPGTIVAIIDETRGADAIVAYESAVPNIDALNRTDMKFVLTPDSPSDTLTRAVMSQYQMDNLPKNPYIKAKDAEDVYKQWVKTNPKAPRAFVLWEPYVSKILANPNTHVVADSSQHRGYIVDAIVVNRDYLVNNHDVVREILGAYFRARYHYRDNMVQLVLDDAKKTGAPLKPAQAENLVNGIWWKNTQENFAHFGLQSSGQLQLLEDMITGITRVLSITDAIQQDPTNGQPTDLYYDQLLKELKSSNFHPQLASEKLRDEVIRLPKLNPKQWEQLVPIGTLAVPDLVFPRGRSVLTGTAKATLDDLVAQLQTLPQAYVIVKGNASRVGDLEANKIKARERAVAAASYLRDKGLDPNRIRPVSGEPSGATSVRFVLGQPPY